jgi:uncharacterized iron-regulated membrane protein
MKQILSPGLVKKSLASHSWIGLLVGALMYLVCLSGAIVVFYQEFERWEQPTVHESLEYDTQAIQQAYNTLAAQEAEHHAEEQHAEDEHEHKHMYVTLPTESVPRTVVSSDTGGWFVNSDGSLGEKVQHDWTHMLIHLHLYLHLPGSFGMIVVSILGAMLCGLIISGFLAHPGIFKDAFNLRLKGARRLEQVDIHNRLSVWGAPFHLMIAITGAFFGLAAIVSLVLAAAFFEGDTEAVIPAVYGAEPELDQPIGNPAIGKALEQMDTIAPGTTPFYVTVEEAGTPGQYMIVGTEHPGRLIYAEQYRFDSAGNYLDKVGFSDGEAGRQIIFSVYRIHFGHFGGFAVKILYAIFGLALTVVSVTGINIWLVKRKTRDYLNNVWTGLVWGTPAALVLTGITQVIIGIPSTGILWVSVVAAIALAQYLDDDNKSKALLQMASALLLTALVTLHMIKFGWAVAPVAMGLNLTLLIIAMIFLLMGLRQIRKPLLGEALA